VDNLIYALIFHVLGAVVRTVYGFMAKIITSDQVDKLLKAIPKTTKNNT